MNTIKAKKIQPYLYGIQKGAKFSQQHLTHVVATTCVSQHQNWSPAIATGRCQLQKHTNTNNALNSESLKTHIIIPLCLYTHLHHLIVLIRVSLAEFVDMIEVVGWDDETVKLAQVTVVWFHQVAHAVIVYCVLAPHTPEVRIVTTVSYADNYFFIHQ